MVSRLSALHCLVALGLAAPRVANAEPAPEAEAGIAQTSDAPDPEPSTEPNEPDATGQGGLDQPDPEDLDDEDLDDEDLDDEDLDDEDLDDEGLDAQAEVPESMVLPDRLPRLQRIGWYHVLGAFTLGTTAGLLAGLAEREEDRATRIAAGYDFESGSAPLYRDRQRQYEQILDRGQAFETSAIVVGALAGATAIAAITLFAVDARRKAPSPTARRTRVGPGAMEVRF